MHARHARSSAEAKPAIIVFNKPASALALVSHCVNRFHPQNLWINRCINGSQKCHRGS